MRKSPTVISIPVYLPNRNFGQMRRGVTSVKLSSSKLLRYFTRPCVEEFQFLYILDYYHQYHLELYNPQILLCSDEFLEQPTSDTRFEQCQVIRRVGAPVVMQ